MPDVPELLDRLDLVVARAEGVVPDAVRSRAAAEARRLRRRRGFLGDTFVMAIAGGTGSGKSSLLNAIAGEELASVSPVRPHTDAPLAWIPDGTDPAIGRLLDDLGVADRRRNDRLPGVALVDLPDMDSVAGWHRTVVEDLLPRVDAVLWVFDPVKYHDAILHEEFLAPVSGHGRRLVFVLNQTDRLDPGDVDRVRDHLLTILHADGYREPTLLLTAVPPQGPAEGIEALRDHLARRLDAKRVALTALAGDVHAAARLLARAAGVWERTGVDFERRREARPFPELRAELAEEADEVTRALLDGLPEEPEAAVARLREHLVRRAVLGATVAEVAIGARELLHRWEGES
jgi:Predicted GTPase